jgi:hypothetical protein
MLFSFIIVLISLRILWQPSHQRRKLINAIKKQRVLQFVGGYPPPKNAKSVQRAIEALGADVALASFRLDKFRANFISEFEANFLSQMDDALDRKRKQVR